MRNLSNIFKGLSDETRLQMLDLLQREGELCVCDFTDLLEITQSKASRHLRHLVNAGLIADRRAGTWVYFRISDSPEPAQAQLIATLPLLFPKRLEKELSARLKSWRKTKARGDSSCATPATKQASKSGASK